MIKLPFPFKKNAQFNIEAPMKKYIEAYHDIQSYKQVEDVMKYIQQLRNELDFKALEQKISFKSPDLFEATEQKIITYVRFLNLLKSRFKFDQYSVKHVIINVKWSDSFKKTDFAASSITYEISCMLYNLMLIYMKDGAYLLAFNDDGKSKMAIKKLQGALWCIQQINLYLPGIPYKPNQKQADFSGPNLNICCYTCIAMCYMSLYQIFLKQEFKKGSDFIASLARLVARNFQTASNVMLKEMKKTYPPNLNHTLNSNFKFFVLKFNVIAIDKYCSHHQSLIEDEPLGNHMGFTLAYYRKAQNMLRVYTSQKDKQIGKIFIKQEIQVIRQMDKDIAQKFQKAQIKNQGVYKEVECDQKRLPDIKATDAKIGPKAPADYDKPLQESKAFVKFVSGDMEVLLRQFQNIKLDQKKKLTDNLQLMTQNKKHIIQTNHVNFLVTDVNTLKNSSTKIPPVLQKQIQVYQNSGGFQAINKYMSDLQQIGQQCSSMITVINNAAQQERSGDLAMKQKYGTQWVRVVSDIANQDNLQKIKEFSGKLQSAQNIDANTIRNFQQHQELAKILSGSMDQIANTIPQSLDIEFLAKNQDKVAIIKKHLEILDKIETKCQQIVGMFSSQDEEAGMIQKFSPILQHSNQKDAIFNKELSPLQKEAKKFQALMTHAKKSIDAVAAAAEQINKDRKGGQSGESSKKIQEMNSTVNVIIEISKHSQKGVAFYNKFMSILADLQSKNNDYIQARQLEMQAWVKHLDGQIQQQQQQQQQIQQQKQQYEQQQQKVQKSQQMQRQESQKEEVFWNEDAVDDDDMGFPVGIMEQPKKPQQPQQFGQFQQGTQFFQPQNYVQSQLIQSNQGFQQQGFPQQGQQQGFQQPGFPQQNQQQGYQQQGFNQQGQQFGQQQQQMQQQQMFYQQSGQQQQGYQTPGFSQYR